MEGLGIDLGVLISQIVNFVLLFLALYFLLFKRVLAMLDERRQKIQQGLERAERAEAEAARTEAVFQERMGQIEQKR